MEFTTRCRSHSVCFFDSVCAANIMDARAGVSVVMHGPGLVNLVSVCPLVKHVEMVQILTSDVFIGLSNDQHDCKPFFVTRLGFACEEYAEFLQQRADSDELIHSSISLQSFVV